MWNHLAHHFRKAIPISGTQKLHAFILSCCGAKINKTFSFATTSTSYQVISKGEMLDFRDMNGYAISMYNEKWWLSYVLGENEVKVTFLHPSEPSPSFSYPLTLDVLWIPSSDIIYKVNSVTPTGRMNILPVEKKKKITEIMNLF
ncbi:hypothetical protein AVEN_172053-1 [Araneus ventricosus]|uniref:Uncharacterized protein n=1 Tax=Araneus ventricosus TaxID=182803 RepID=A0A4Y2MJ04_ARAVE|nr:hypothetical protein AVEN_172053-1 [Araneus ventricosus]